MKKRNETNSKIRPEEKNPDRTKCEEQRSRDLAGRTAGDRGMCERESITQGSE
jgi:hypothetical protein